MHISSHIPSSPTTQPTIQTTQPQPVALDNGLSLTPKSTQPGGDILLLKLLEVSQSVSVNLCVGWKYCTRGMAWRRSFVYKKTYLYIYERPPPPRQQNQTTTPHSPTPPRRRGSCAQRILGRTPRASTASTTSPSTAPAPCRSAGAWVFVFARDLFQGRKICDARHAYISPVIYIIHQPTQTKLTTSNLHTNTGPTNWASTTAPSAPPSCSPPPPRGTPSSPACGS